MIKKNNEEVPVANKVRSTAPRKGLPFAYDPQSEAWKFLLNPSKGKSCTVGS